MAKHDGRHYETGLLCLVKHTLRASIHSPRSRPIYEEGIDTTLHLLPKALCATGADHLIFSVSRSHNAANGRH